MAFDAGSVKGELDLDASKFLSELKKVESRLDGVEKELKSGRKEVDGFGKKLAAAAVGIATFAAGFLAARAALRGFTTLLTESAREAGAYEQVVRELAVALQLAGDTGFAATTESIKEYASAVQNVSAFSDSMVVEVAKTLTILGVQKEDLQKNTQAILDYSAATGSDAVQAARLFGKTFGGALGELSEALPALKALTKEQLEAGEAFDFAGEAFEGFAEKVATTTEGLSAQLGNTVDDFQKQVGALINPFLNEIKAGGIEVFKALTAELEENRGSVSEFFRESAIGAIEALRGLVGTITEVRLAIFDLKSTFDSTLPAMLGTFKQFQLELAELSLSLNEAVDLGDPSSATIAGRKRVAELKQEVDGLAEAWRASTLEIEEGRAKIEAQGDTIAQFLNPLLDKAVDKVEAVTTEFAAAGDGIAKLNLGATDTANAFDAAAIAAGKTKQEILDAADAADQLASSAGRASSGFGSGGGGGSSGGGGDGGFGRRSGGSFSVTDSDNVFSSINNLNELDRRLIGAGGRQGSEQAFAFVSSVRAAVQGQIDQAVAAFSRNVVNDLNRAGINDPGERSRQLNSRLAEARRLGVIPDERSATVAAGATF